MSQKNSQHFSQNMLIYSDLHMVEKVQLLSGEDLCDYVEQYCSDNRSLQIRKWKETYKVMPEFLENKEKSLYQHLAFQIAVSFSGKEKEEALTVAASLDKNGFYRGYKSSVLKKMHFLDPVGVACLNSKEAMLIQLEDRAQRNTLSYAILEKSYDAFLRSDFKTLTDNHGCTIEEIKSAIKKIVSLNPFPARGFDAFIAKHITAEIKIDYNSRWGIYFAKDHYPEVILTRNGSNKETQEAKTFIYQLNKRKDRLEKITSSIIRAHEDYFLESKDLKVLERKEIYESLDIAASTFSRILNEKYIDTPRGVFPLMHFFSSEKSSSKEKAMKILKELIEIENRKKPYSDQKLSNLLKEQGFDSSRRTIAKYRKQMAISGAYHRLCR